MNSSTSHFGAGWLPVAWVVSVICVVATFAIEHIQPFLGVVLLLYAAGPVFLLCSFVYVLVLFCALWKRRWRYLVRHTLIIAITFAATWTVAYFIEHPTSGPRAWHSTPSDVPFPFAVEWRLADEFCADWHKRIVFPSGHRTGLPSGEASNSPLAVYALDSGRYAIAFKDTFTPYFYVFRIDSAKETVDWLSDGLWYPLPPDAVDFISWGADGPLVKTRKGTLWVNRGVPAGDEYFHRRFLGFVSTSGSFEPSTSDPFPDPLWPPSSVPGLPDNE